MDEKAFGVPFLHKYAPPILAALIHPSSGPELRL